MAKLRPAKCYRDGKQSYTRVSKYKRKAFIKGVPGSKLVQYDMGRRNKLFPFRISLVSKESKIIRHNSLESARMAANRKLVKHVGAENFSFKINVYPHRVLRENPIAAGAGADRFQSGMSHCFGKPLSTGAGVKPDQEVMFVTTAKQNVDFAKKALKLASDKMGCKFRIEVTKR